MTVRRLAPDQPRSFAFTKSNGVWAAACIKRYPRGRQASAVVPLLWRAQEQHENWLPEAAIAHVGALLNMAPLRVLEIATFYSMFNLAPVGRYFVQVCGTTPCMLCNSAHLNAVCERQIGPMNQVTSNGLFSWVEVECLGACVNAPVVQINKDYYEDVQADVLGHLLTRLAAGETVTPGSQTGRTTSAPSGGLSTLLSRHGAQSAPRDAVPPTSPAASLAPATRRDPLQMISGIGPRTSAALNAMGIHSYQQIADWNSEDVARIRKNLPRGAHAEPDRWIEQARSLCTRRTDPSTTS